MTKLKWLTHLLFFFTLIWLFHLLLLSLFRLWKWGSPLLAPIVKTASSLCMTKTSKPESFDSSITSFGTRPWRGESGLRKRLLLHVMTLPQITLISQIHFCGLSCIQDHYLLPIAVQHSLFILFIYNNRKTVTMRVMGGVFRKEVLRRRADVLEGRVEL